VAEDGVVKAHIAWLRAGDGLEPDALGDARAPRLDGAWFMGYDPGSWAQWAILGGVNGYPGVVTKRLIDVDDDKLAAVRALLGTKSLKATVDAALDEVIALDQRRRALLAERGVDLSKLADPAARDAAWG
jgi:Arc/MetJ family transcription regulator